MSKKTQWIDAVALSRRLRIETGKELAKMSPDERIKFLNDYARNHPIMRKKMKPQSASSDDPTA